MFVITLSNPFLELQLGTLVTKFDKQLSSYYELVVKVTKRI